MTALRRWVIGQGLFIVFAAAHGQVQSTSGNCSPVLQGVGRDANVVINCPSLPPEKLDEVRKAIRNLPTSQQMERASELLERLMTSRLTGPVMTRAVEESTFKRAVALYQNDLKPDARRLVDDLIRNAVFERVAVPSATVAKRLSKYYVFAAALAPGGRADSDSSPGKSNDIYFAQKAIAEDPDNLMAWKKGAAVEFVWLRDSDKVLESFKTLTRLSRIRTAREKSVDSREDFIEAASWVTDASERRGDVSLHEDWLLDEVEVSGILNSEAGMQFYLLLARRLALRFNTLNPISADAYKKLRVPISTRLSHVSATVNVNGFSKATSELFEDALLVTYTAESNEDEVKKILFGGSAAALTKRLLEGEPMAADIWKSDDAPKVGRLLYILLFIHNQGGVKDEDKPAFETIKRVWTSFRNANSAPFAYTSSSSDLAKCPDFCKELVSIDYFRGSGFVPGIRYISYDAPLIEAIRKRREKLWVTEISP